MDAILGQYSLHGDELVLVVTLARLVDFAAHSVNAAEGLDELAWGRGGAMSRMAWPAVHEVGHGVVGRAVGGRNIVMRIYPNGNDSEPQLYPDGRGDCSIDLPRADRATSKSFAPNSPCQLPAPPRTALQLGGIRLAPKTLLDRQRLPGKRESAAAERRTSMRSERRTKCSRVGRSSGSKSRCPEFSGAPLSSSSEVGARSSDWPSDSKTKRYYAYEHEQEDPGRLAGAPT
jgi:hypothetical protein